MRPPSLIRRPSCLHTSGVPCPASGQRLHTPHGRRNPVV